MTPPGAVSTAVTGRPHTNSTPAALHASNSSRSVTTWGRLVNGGGFDGSPGGYVFS